MDCQSRLELLAGKFMKELIALTVVIIGCLLIGFIIGAGSMQSSYRSESVKMGHAEYFIVNTNTGATQWRWK